MLDWRDRSFPVRASVQNWNKKFHELTDAEKDALVESCASRIEDVRLNGRVFTDRIFRFLVLIHTGGLVATITLGRSLVGRVDLWATLGMPLAFFLSGLTILGILIIGWRILLSISVVHEINALERFKKGNQSYRKFQKVWRRDPRQKFRILGGILGVLCFLLFLAGAIAGFAVLAAIESTPLSPFMP